MTESILTKKANHTPHQTKMLNRLLKSSEASRQQFEELLTAAQV